MIHPLWSGAGVFLEADWLFMKDTRPLYLGRIEYRSIPVFQNIANGDPWIPAASSRMTYCTHEFGRQLLDEIDCGYDIVRISRWAMATYSEQSMHADETLLTEILKVVAMEEGPQFEYTEEELRDSARRLTQS